MKKVLILLSALLLVGCNSFSSESSFLASSIIDSLSVLSEISSENEQSSYFLESTSLSEEICKSITITCNEVPNDVNGGYASDGELTFNNVIFFYSNIMSNTGKYDTPTIQMKKEIGYLYNVTPLSGILTLKLMKNSYHDYVNNVDVISNVVPTIYVGNEANSFFNTIEGEVVEENENMITYRFEEASLYHYFKISNESGFAQYLVSLSWNSY